MPDIVYYAVCQRTGWVTIHSMFDAQKPFIFFVGPFYGKPLRILNYHASSIRFDHDAVKRIDKGIVG